MTHFKRMMVAEVEYKNQKFFEFETHQISLYTPKDLFWGNSQNILVCCVLKYDQLK